MDIELQSLNIINSVFSHMGQFIIGFICYKFFWGRIIQLFVWILFLNFFISVMVLISINFTENVTTKVFILMVDGIFSSLLYYLGTTILPFDLGKIILL